jgi:hypothetical protein
MGTNREAEVLLAACWVVRTVVSSRNMKISANMAGAPIPACGHHDITDRAEGLSSN